MNGKQLKNSILLWAIQGKLVPQDPNDEPASVLLERIRAEKARLVKEGKIKKDKNESIIFRGEDNSYYEKFVDGKIICIDEEIPFEIPQGWEWARISSIFKTTSGGTPDKGHVEYYSNPTIPWLRSGELDYKYVTETELKISESGMNNSSAKLFPVNTVVVAMYGATVGQVSILGIETTTNQAICGIFPIDGILPEYLFYFFQAKRTDYLEKAFGSGQPNISQEVIKKTLLPIPPYKEQQRIVTKADYISALVDKFDSSQKRLNSLNTSIKTNFRKSILQDAIQGRLVNQDLTDDPVNSLLEQINKEKGRLLQRGFLKKKDMVDSVIFKGEDNKYYETIEGRDFEIELPFSFPESWAIVRLQTICGLMDGERKEGDGICLDAKFLRGKKSGDHLQFGRFVHKGDIIILVDGENSGEVFTTPVDGYMGSTFKQLWISEALHSPYILACINYYKEALRNSKKGAAIPHLDKNLFNKLIIGIPPLKEQERITAQLDAINEYL